MSAFDPSAYLDSTMSAPTTRRPALPAGREFIGTIGEVKSKSWESKKDPSNPKSGVLFEVPIELDISAFPDLVEVQGTSKVTLTDTIMLDLTPGGLIDNAPGKNNKLRRYREALDLNKPGDVFGARMMQGRFVRAKIKHDPYEGEIYDKIDSVARP